MTRAAKLRLAVAVLLLAALWFSACKLPKIVIRPPVVSQPTTTTTLEPTTTTSTSTTTTTTTLPPATPVLPTPPPPAPSPAPTCIPEPPMPPGPVDVRNGLKPSSCTSLGENRKCFKDQPSGEGVLWQADERSCWPAWVVAEQGRSPKVLGGTALMCEAGYLSDPDDTSRGCFDAYGRRYQWDGGAWREQALEDRFSGWWLGICPPRAPKTCATPAPAAQCYRGPWRFECRFPSCEIQGEPGGSRYESVAAEAIKKLGVAGMEIPEPDALTISRLIADELRARGYCAATHDDKANRLSDDEIGVWEGSNPRVENLDFCRASGAKAGHCVVLERPFMVARGWTP